MLRVKTSVGTWNTGDQFFSDVTLAHGTGTFNLLYSPANRHRPEIPLFNPPIVPNGVLYLCKSH